MATKYHHMLVKEMQTRGLEKKTQADYIRTMQLFCEYHKKTAEKLDLPDVKSYQHYLVTHKKLAPNSVNRHLSGIKFFYKNIMGRHWYDDALPRMKAVRKLPQVLSEEEVASMIKAVESPFYKAVIMVTYSAGLRQGEVRNLKITDIDSKRMVIHISNGKGGKDRQALLSPVALEYLRDYWRSFRVKNPVKSDWLFIPNKNSYGGELKKKLSHTALDYIFKKAARLAGIKKKFIPIFSGTHLQPIY